jgi:acetyl-CoA carboxylase biotin carboxyl carrier protein
MDAKKKVSWLERVEDIVTILEGSTVGELELVEGETEIVIRREPGMVMSAVPVQQVRAAGAVAPPGGGGQAARVDHSVAVVAPLTGVYYSAASPTSPPFVNVGDTIHVGQVVALIESMKVFNEVMAEVAGRVVALVATTGNVVQKGETLLRVEPL